MYAAGVSRALLWAIGLSACAATVSGPFYGDEAYLRFGVDPRSEAAELAKNYAEHDEQLELRLDGQHFTALGFMTRSGVMARVRVVTDRGIQLALDPQTANALGQPSVSYALLPAPIRDTQDADGDGFEEVFVVRSTPTASCLLIYRVRDVGFVDALPTSLSMFGAKFCPTDLADVDADGRIELLVQIALTGFEPLTPRIRVPLWASQHQFVLRARPDALEHELAREYRARLAELSEARRRFAILNAQRLAIELAAIAHIRGQTPEQQVLEFDNAIGGLVLDEHARALAQAARTTIFQRWNPARPAAPDLVHQPAHDAQRQGRSER